jgi:hypothetical protein
MGRSLGDTLLRDNILVLLLAPTGVSEGGIALA